MYTEDELRAALEHSAARADASALPTDTKTESLAESVANPHRVDRRWLRIGMPAAAAAAVVAAAVVTAFVSQSGTSQGLSGDGTTRHHHRTGGVHHSRQATRRHEPRAVPNGTSVDVTSVPDAIQAGAPGQVSYDLGGNGYGTAGSETVRQALGRVRSIVVDYVPDTSSQFDPSRISRSQPVSIDGRTGYYSLFKLYPLDANTGPSSDKYLPVWTIAFRVHDGWAFASLQKATPADDPNSTDVSVDDPSAIAAAYQDLEVSYVADQTKLAFTIGYLPDGLTLDSVQLDTGYRTPGFQGIFLVSGDRSIDIELLDQTPSAPHCLGACGETVTSELGHGVYLQVTGQGYDLDTVTQIAQSIAPAADLTDPSTYYSLDRAFHS